MIFVLELITSKGKSVLAGDGGHLAHRVFIRLLLILRCAIDAELVGLLAEALRVLRPRRTALPVDAVVP